MGCTVKNLQINNYLDVNFLTGMSWRLIWAQGQTRKNFRTAFSSAGNKTNVVAQRSLQGCTFSAASRVKHFSVGLLLAIPLISAITILALRRFGNTSIASQTPSSKAALSTLVRTTQQPTQPFALPTQPIITTPPPSPASTPSIPPEPPSASPPQPFDDSANIKEPPQAEPDSGSKDPPLLAPLPPVRNFDLESDLTFTNIGGKMHRLQLIESKQKRLFSLKKLVLYLTSAWNRLFYRRLQVQILQITSLAVLSPWHILVSSKRS